MPCVCEVADQSAAKQPFTPSALGLECACRSGACGCAATSQTRWCCETASHTRGLPPTRCAAGGMKRSPLPRLPASHQGSMPCANQPSCPSPNLLCAGGLRGAARRGAVQLCRRAGAPGGLCAGRRHWPLPSLCCHHAPGGWHAQAAVPCCPGCAVRQAGCAAGGRGARRPAAHARPAAGAGGSWEAGQLPATPNLLQAVPSCCC